jgi:hypothetical protein
MNFKAGDSIKYSTVTKGTTESATSNTDPVQAKEPPKAKTSKIDMSADANVKITKVEGGVASVEFKTANVKVNGPSNEPGAQMLQNMAKASEGRTVTLKYRPNGRLADEKPSVNMMQMADSMANFFGFMGLTFPDGPTKVGDTWSSEVDMAKLTAGSGSSGMTWSNAKLPASYTLRSIDRAAGTAVIEFTIKGSPVMTIKMPEPRDEGGKAKTPPDMPREMKMSMNFQVTGKSVVELATGLPRESTSTSTVTTSSPMMGKMKQNLTTTTKRA